MTATGTTFFDRTTTLQPVGADMFRTVFDPSWTSLNGVLGGFVAAHAVRAVEHTDAERPVRTVSASFLRPTAPGEAHITVAPLRVGRTVATYAVVVEQGGRPTLHARVTTAAPTGPDPLVWKTDSFEMPPPPDTCEPIDPPPGTHHFDQAVAVLDPAWRPFSGRPRARVAGWVRPLEPRPIDAAWLTMALDWFPPAAFARAAPPVGAVSVEYGVHVHRTLPVLTDEWLAGVFRTDTAAGGLALEHGIVASADGTPLAECFHTRIA